MLRIDQRREGNTIVIKAEGGVAGPWVAELGRALDSLNGTSTDVALDLSAVGYVDSGGEQLLREAVSKGMRIRERSGFVAALLDAGTRAPSDRDLARAILAGSEAAFLSLASRCHEPMLGVTRCFVASEAAAKQLVHHAWSELLSGLKSWDGRQPLESWAMCVAARRARAHAARGATEALAGWADEAGPAVCPEHLRPQDHSSEADCFSEPLDTWGADELELPGALDATREAIDALPPMQRAVMTMRDVVGCGAVETRSALNISEAEQRVLLHRARSNVHAAIDAHFRTAA
jgi:RNA polymerase sigma-70 factor (ECF subfamily)